MISNIKEMYKTFKQQKKVKQTVFYINYALFSLSKILKLHLIN